jgi:hypothetical protein
MRIQEVTQISSATANSTKLTWLAVLRLGCHLSTAQINVPADQSASSGGQWNLDVPPMLLARADEVIE